jgi:ABC-type uncharacterized transport system ATPase subunit
VNVLRFTGVRKSFGDRLVLDRLSFSVGAAEVYGLLGPNGSGKSTAINILCNLLDPDDGTIEVAGKRAQMVAKTSVGVCPRIPILAIVNSADEVAPLASVAPFLDKMLAKDTRVIEYPGEIGVGLQHLDFQVISYAV